MQEGPEVTVGVKLMGKASAEPFLGGGILLDLLLKEKQLEWK